MFEDEVRLAEAMADHTLNRLEKEMRGTPGGDSDRAKHAKRKINERVNPSPGKTTPFRQARESSRLDNNLARIALKAMEAGNQTISRDVLNALVRECEVLSEVISHLTEVNRSQDELITALCVVLLDIEDSLASLEAEPDENEG